MIGLRLPQLYSAGCAIIYMIRFLFILITRVALSGSKIRECRKNELLLFTTDFLNSTAAVWLSHRPAAPPPQKKGVWWKYKAQSLRLLSHVSLRELEYFPPLSFLACRTQQEIVCFRHALTTGSTPGGLSEGSYWTQRGGGSAQYARVLAALFAHWCNQTSHGHCTMQHADEKTC